MSDKDLNLISVAVAEIQAELENLQYLDVKQLVKAAMIITKHHWLLTNDDERFLAAVAGAALLSNEDDKARLLTEVEFLKKLSDAIGSKDSEKYKEIPDLPNPVGLLTIWAGLS
jgi:hypothetical protein